MTNLNEKLLPCPFCGGTEAFVERLDYSSAYVQCDSDVGDSCACYARGPLAVQDDDGEEIPGGAGAIRAWNRRAPAAAPAPVAASDNVHELDAAMSLLRVAQSLNTAKIAPAKLRDQVMQSVMSAAGANGKGEEYIFADVYENLSTMIAPYVNSGEPDAMHPFPASVVDTFTMLLEHYFAAPAAPAAAPIVQPVADERAALRKSAEALGLPADRPCTDLPVFIAEMFAFTDRRAAGPLLRELRAIIADDGHAATFQSFGQYRSALLKVIDTSRAAITSSAEGAKA